MFIWWYNANQNSIIKLKTNTRNFTFFLYVFNSLKTSFFTYCIIPNTQAKSIDWVAPNHRSGIILNNSLPLISFSFWNPIRFFGFSSGVIKRLIALKTILNWVLYFFSKATRFAGQFCMGDKSIWRSLINACMTSVFTRTAIGLLKRVISIRQIRRKLESFEVVAICDHFCFFTFS